MFGLKLKYIPWNDHGFYTHYNLYFTYKMNENEEPFKLGRVLIVDPKRSELKNKDEPYRNEIDIEGMISSLGENYVSLGYSKQYYLQLHLYNKKFPGLTEFIKENLHDMVLNETVDRYKDFEFFKTSFTRAFSVHMIENVFPRIVRTGNEKKNYYLNFGFDSKTFNGEITVDTRVDAVLPNNVYAVIGNNGVGKTRLLKKIIRKLNGTDYKTKSEGEHYDINKILLLSMSSFDNHKKYISRNDDIEYVGIINYDNKSSLKTSEVLLSELYEFLRRIRSDDYKEEELAYVLDELMFKLDSFLRDFIVDKILDYKMDNRQQEDESTKNNFLNSLKDDFEKLSSGQINLLYMTFSLIAIVEEDMFAVIDEPELYLHPLYIMGYINLLNYIFERRNAIAFIATHSPLIIQQIPTQCVYKISFDVSEDKRMIKSIDFPCFGENLNIINDRIFNITKNKAGFFKELSGKKISDLKEIYENEKIGIEAKLFIKQRFKKEGKENENSPS